ncbi:MAG: N-acyl homoserine lactonase family protein [Thermodesulfobacteriota bacterium]
MNIIYRYITPMIVLFFAISFLSCVVKPADTESHVSGVKKLYIMDCGYITANDLSIFSSEGLYKGETKELVDTCYLIEHEKGILLWDAGLSDSLAGKGPVEAGGGAFTLEVKKTLASQLEEIGVKPEDVEYISFSHMHFDHTGNANYFTGSTWLTPQAEYDTAWGPREKAEMLFFAPDSYSALKNSKTIKYEGDYDVFGDGSVKILAAPGHTPGSQVLLLKLNETGPVILGGDLYHFTENRTYRRVPAFNFDIEQSKTSIERIEDITAKEKAKFIIQHDKEQHAELDYAPKFLK